MSEYFLALDVCQFVSRSSNYLLWSGTSFQNIPT